MKSKIILLTATATATAGFVSVEPVSNGVAVYNCDSEGKHLPVPDPTDPFDNTLLDLLEDRGTDFAYESERRLACAARALQKWGIV